MGFLPVILMGAYHWNGEGEHEHMPAQRQAKGKRENGKQIRD